MSQPSPVLTLSRAPGGPAPAGPSEVGADRSVTIGIHIGRRIATVAVGDLSGNVLAHETLHRERGDAPDLARLSRTAAAILAGLPGRVPLSAGLVGPWRELGLDAEQLGRDLGALTGLPVRSTDHIAAVAATEFFHRQEQDAPGVVLYVYARDTVGFAVAADDGERIEVSRIGSLTHFPTGGTTECPCGRTGCMEVEAGDEAVVRSAVSLGLIHEPTIDAVYATVGHPVGSYLLRTRARALGRAAACVRDIMSPDRVVLVGQAFTGCEPVLEEITRAFEQTTALGAIPLSFTRFGADIQAVAACTVALGAVPGATRRRTRTRSTLAV